MILRSLFALLLLSASGLVLADELGNLTVEVRIEGQQLQYSREFGVGVQRNRPVVQGNDRQVRQQQTQLQRLVVMDGGSATLSDIKTQILKLRQVVVSPFGQVVSESLVYRNLGGSVRVSPRRQGDTAVIVVSAEESRPVSQAATNQAGTNALATETLRLSTTLRARLGEWVMIGDDQSSDQQSQRGAGVNNNASVNHAQAGVVNLGSSESSGSQRVWLRVLP